MDSTENRPNERIPSATGSSPEESSEVHVTDFVESTEDSNAKGTNLDVNILNEIPKWLHNQKSQSSDLIAGLELLKGLVEKSIEQQKGELSKYSSSVASFKK